MLREIQQFPKQFDSSELKINIKCPKPSYIVSGMNYDVKNKQSVIPQRSNRLPKQAQTTQEKFQNTRVQNIGLY